MVSPVGVTYIYYPLNDTNFRFEDDEFFNIISAPGVNPYFDTISGRATCFILLSLAASALCLPCLVFYISHRSIPAIANIGWILFLNLAGVTNAFIWPTDNVATWFNGVGYCDAQVKLVNASALGLPSALCAMFRGLASALDTEKGVVNQTRASRKRDFLCNMLLCLGLPLYAISVEYIVQEGRYFIYAVSGCVPSWSHTWLTLILVHIPPTLVCLVSGYLAGLVSVRVYRYRKRVSTVLQSSGSKMTANRFVRLYILSMLQLFVVLPIQVYILVLNIPSAIYPYSFAGTHDPEVWNYIGFAPMFGRILSDRWVHAISGLAIFLALGIGSEAKEFYRKILISMGFGIFFPYSNKHQPSDRDSGSYFSTSSTLWERTRSFSRKLSSIGFSKRHRFDGRHSHNGSEKSLSFTDSSGASPRTVHFELIPARGNAVSVETQIVTSSSSANELSPASRAPAVSSGVSSGSSSAHQSEVPTLIPVHGRALSATTPVSDNKPKANGYGVLDGPLSIEDRLFEVIETSMELNDMDNNDGLSKYSMGMDGTLDGLGERKRDTLNKLDLKLRRNRNLRRGDTGALDSKGELTERSFSTTHSLTSSDTAHTNPVSSVFGEDALLKELGVINCNSTHSANNELTTHKRYSSTAKEN